MTTIRDGKRLSFGVKTSQMNLGYDDILRVWCEADTIPVFEHAWLWDHMVPLRGPVNGAALEAWTLLAALAASGANVLDVTHERTGPKLHLDEVEVALQLETRGPAHCQAVLAGLRAAGYPLSVDQPV